MKLSLVSLLLPLASLTGNDVIIQFTDLNVDKGHRSPYSGCLDYSYDNTQYHSWLLNEKLELTRETLAVLDSKIEEDIYNLPDKIVTAGEDILDGIRDSNHDYGSIVALISLGRVIRIAGAVQGVTSASLETILGTVLGPSLISASFAASRVNRLRRPELGCDVNSYVTVFRQYEVTRE